MITNCGYCGFAGAMLFVHSHYQCPRCHNNILPCCEGECTQPVSTPVEKKEGTNSNLSSLHPNAATDLSRN